MSVLWYHAYLPHILTADPPHSTGKRSKEGALQDGVNSVIRYIKNNFLDGPRQDSYDLVSGAWVPRVGQETSLRDERDSFTRYVRFGHPVAPTFSGDSAYFDQNLSSQAPYLLVLALTFLFLTLLAPALVNGAASLSSGAAAARIPSVVLTHDLSTDYLISTRKLTLASLMLGGVALNHILNNGVDYVAWPRLVVLDEVLAYSGKGYESGRRGRPVRAVSETKRAAKKDGSRKDSVLPILGQTTTKLD